MDLDPPDVGGEVRLQGGRRGVWRMPWLVRRVGKKSSSGGLSSGSSKPPLVPEVVPDVREVPRHRSLARCPCEETYLRKEKDEGFGLDKIEHCY